jgi:PPOX class probable F420-dependent enzyme
LESFVPHAPIPPEISAFLARPNTAVLATLRPAGGPHTVPIWYDLEADGRIVMNMDIIRPRLRWLERDARVSLSCIDPVNFYRHVSLLGEIAETRPDPDRSVIDRLSLRYTGKPYPRTTHERVSVWMRIDSWHGWDRRPDDQESSAPLPVFPWVGPGAPSPGVRPS